MTLKKFFVCSVILHLIALYGIYLVPVHKTSEPAGFFARLVSPEEVLEPEIKPPEKRSLTRAYTRVPKKPLSPPPVKRQFRSKPSDEKPEVPGESSYTGKPLPEGKLPAPGKEALIKKDEGVRTPEKPGYSEEEKIFDRDIIGDIAKKEFAGKDTGAKKNHSLTFDTGEYRYAGYMRKLKEKIESIWEYPPEAQARGIYGDLKIRFTIRKNGSLGSVELVRTSGYRMLDDAAIKALRDGEPYWPIPDEWGMESYTILGHFIYSIYGYYVR